MTAPERMYINVSRGMCSTSFRNRNGDTEYIRADLVTNDPEALTAAYMSGRYDGIKEHTEAVKRLVEAAKDLLNAITGLCGDEYSCFSTCSLANECDKDSGNECLWVARLRAALEEEV